MSKAEKFIQKKLQSARNATEKAQWERIKDSQEKKKWHQLGLGLLELVQSRHDMNLKELYDEFIVNFASSMSQIIVAKISVKTAVQMYKGGDKPGAHKFLEDQEKFFDKCKEKRKDAETYLKVGQLQLSMLDRNSDENTGFTNPGLVRERVDNARKSLGELVEVGDCHSYFYQQSCEYINMTGTFDEFYREALSYLGHANKDLMPPAEKTALGINVIIAALLGENVYNFDELRDQPIIEYLKGQQQNAWLVELLDIVRAGDHALFAEKRNNDVLKKHSKLPPAEQVLVNKLRIMGLVVHSSTGRVTFAEIAEKTGLPTGDIEAVVMRAVSKGLLRASIDQVNQIVATTWVQPRVLDGLNMEIARSKIAEWIKEVSDMDKLMEEHFVQKEKPKPAAENKDGTCGIAIGTAVNTKTKTGA